MGTGGKKSGSSNNPRVPRLKGRPSGKKEKARPKGGTRRSCKSFSVGPSGWKECCAVVRKECTHGGERRTNVTVKVAPGENVKRGKMRAVRAVPYKKYDRIAKQKPKVGCGRDASEGKEKGFSRAKRRKSCLSLCFREMSKRKTLLCSGGP